MSDDEQNYEVFDGRSAGGSGTSSVACSTLCKNRFVVINGRPCKINDISIDASESATRVNGVDIFTGAQLELKSYPGDFVDVPSVALHEYSLVNVDDGFLNLMSADNTAKDDVKVPPGDLGSQIDYGFKEGKDLLITVMTAMGEQAAVRFREAPKGF